MKPSTYRDMHLLNEVTQTPDATQRDLSKRIGVALGLTNLMLRRLAKKGYIKIVNVQKSRLRYLITPQGVMEKARLTREYIEYSLFFYRNVRSFLRHELVLMLQAGQRRVLLWGTGELAEIAFLTIQELGAELAGVVEDHPDRERFLGYPVQAIDAVATVHYDRVVVASLRLSDSGSQRLATLGVSPERTITLPQASPQGALPKPMVSPETAPADSTIAQPTSTGESLETAESLRAAPRGA